MQPGPINELIKPLAWLLGKWRSISADGQYPTIQPFKYEEQLEFVTLGQPTLNYHSVTWHPEKKNPMHLESGFMRIKPETNIVCLLSAHNFGVSTIEEGTVENTCLNLVSTYIGRMSFVKDPQVIGLSRSYSFDCDTGQLQIVLHMATTRTPLTEHLKIIYQKCE